MKRRKEENKEEVGTKDWESTPLVSSVVGPTPLHTHKTFIVVKTVVMIFSLV